MQLKLAENVLSKYFLIYYAAYYVFVYFSSVDDIKSINSYVYYSLNVDLIICYLFKNLIYKSYSSSIFLKIKRIKFLVI